MEKKIFIIPELVKLEFEIKEILLESEIRSFGSSDADYSEEYPW